MDKHNQTYTAFRAVKTLKHRMLSRQAVIQCRIDVTHELGNCHKTMDEGNVIFPIWKQMLPITPEECYNIHETRKMTYRGHVIMLNDKETEETHYQFTPEGYEQDECVIRKPMTVDGYTYFRDYHKITIHALIRHITGIFNPFGNRIWFPTLRQSRLIKRTYSDFTYWSTDEGRVVWKQDNRTCIPEDMAEVYLGIGALFQKKDRADLVNGVLLMKVGTPDHLGIIIEDIFQFCQTTCYRSHLKNLAFCEVDLSEMTQYKQDEEYHLLKPAIDDTRRHLQKQLQMTQADHKNNSVVLRQVLIAECRIQKERIHRLRTIISKEQYHLHHRARFGIGYRTRNIGSIAYVTQCVPVQVILFNTFPRCTQEIPALYHNRLVFINSISWVIQPYPREIPCSLDTPVMWLILDKWMCATPAISICGTSPITFQPLSPASTELPFPSIPIPTHRPAEKLQQILQFVQFPTLTTPIQQQLANNWALNTYAKCSNYSIMDEEDFHYLSTQLFNDGYFGQWYHTYSSILLTGIIIFTALLDILILTPCRLYGLYRRRGCGTWLISAITTSTTIRTLTNLRVLRTRTHKSPKYVVTISYKPRMDTSTETIDNMELPPFPHLHRKGNRRSISLLSSLRDKAPSRMEMQEMTRSLLDHSRTPSPEPVTAL